MRSLVRLLILALPCVLRAQVRGSDVEVWNEVDISGALTSRATLTVPLVIRDSFQLDNPQLAGVGPILDVELTKHLTVTGGYLFVALPRTGSGYDAHVPLAAVTLRQTLGKIRMQDRNRAEKLFGIPHDPIRYRNKLVVDLGSEDDRWRPFVSDEVFYDFSQSLWSQNRAQIGLGRQMTPQLRLDGFFLERSVHKSDPTSTHAIGVALEIRLSRSTRRKGVSHEEN
jgi:hypothetical protein